MIETKKIDCVKMMREIRDNLHEKYKNNPELHEKRLKEIRIKFNFPSSIIKSEDLENKSN